MRSLQIEILRTERSDEYLRKYSPADAPTIFSLINANREHLSLNGDDTARKYPTLDAVLASIVKPVNPHKLRMGIWVVQTLVGGINLTPIDEETAEIGYWLGAEHERKGYMTCAVRALTQHAIEVGFTEVCGKVKSTNERSISVLERAGYEERNANGFLDKERVFWFEEV